MYVVEDRAVNIVLDTDFMHYVSLETCVEFIQHTFNELRGTDWFGL